MNIPQATAASLDASDARAFRNALGHFGTGVTVITTRDDEGRLYGVTVSSFNSVSLDPPLILWSQALGAPSNPVFQRSPSFAVNVLNGDQQALSNHFARPSEDKFAEVDYELSDEGLPLLRGAAATLICSNDYRLYGGDHTLFLATVQRFNCAPRPRPLFFWRGRYLQPHAPECQSSAVA